MSKAGLKILTDGKFVQGARGVSIRELKYKKTLENGDNVYDVILENDKTVGEVIAKKGDKGNKGDKGDTGNGIKEVAVVSQNKSGKNYKITMTNGNEFMWNVDNGKSAYEIAVDNNFEGDEKKWLESLIGKGLKFEWKGTQLGVKVEDEQSFKYTELKGKDLEFEWKGTQLGVRLKGDKDFKYVNLKGKDINYEWKGTQLGIKLEGDKDFKFSELRGKNIEFEWKGTQLGVKVEGQKDFKYVELKGATGETGKTGAKGEQGKQGIQGEKGAKGDTGNGIKSITLKGQDSKGGNVYTITFTNGQTAEITAPKGATGEVKGNGVPAVQKADNRVFLRNDNTWHTITPDEIGAIHKNDQWRIKPKSIGNANTVTDLNDIREQGHYISSSSANKITNSPSGMTAFELTVTGISEAPNSYKTQLLKDFSSNKYFVRTQTNWQEPMTWTAWTELGSGGNKNPLDSLSFSINGNGELILEYNTEFAPNFSLKDGQLFYKFGNNGEMNLGRVAQDLTPLNNQINSNKAMIDYINSQLVNFVETKKIIFNTTLGNGTITLTESYKNFDYIEILFSNDAESMYCTSRFPVSDIEFARSKGKPYELQTWSACFWRVNIANDTTWTSAGENSIIKQIRGIKVPKYIAKK